MQEWTNNGVTYEINSMYALPENSWTYELTGPPGTPGAAAGLAVTIPDTTPDGEQFTPTDSDHASVTATHGPLPWPVLMRFIRRVQTTGDIVSGAATETVTGDLRLSVNSWRFAGRTFQVNSYHDSQRDGWCYELYEVDPTSTCNDYIDVQIPDLQPAGGPFVPAAAGQVVLAAYGNPMFPWPVFRHFLDAITASGDIVADPE